MSVLNKLNVIQTELKAPKGQFNSFGKYKYRNCEDILEAVKPLLKEHQCALTVGDDLIQIGERYYIKATATLHDCETGETASNSALAREEDSKKGMDSSQVTGATSSYARKYALNGLLAIDDNKDADSDEHKTQAENKDKQAKSDEEADKISKEKVKKSNVDALKARMETKGVTDAKICAAYGVLTLEELNLEQWQSAMHRLEKS